MLKDKIETQNINKSFNTYNKKIHNEVHKSIVLNSVKCMSTNSSRLLSYRTSHQTTNTIKNWKNQNNVWSHVTYQGCHVQLPVPFILIDSAYTHI